MYCHKCGKQNPNDSQFCKHCGAKIGEDHTEATVNTTSTTVKKKSSKASIVGIIVGFLAYAISFQLGRSMGLTIVFLICAWFIGYWFSNWFIKKHRDGKFFPIVAWLSRLTHKFTKCAHEPFYASGVAEFMVFPTFTPVFDALNQVHKQVWHRQRFH